MALEKRRKLRTFIAIDLPSQLKFRLAEVLGKLQSVGGKIRWTAIENIHITLKFLGDLTPEAIESLKSGLRREVAPFEPFHVRLVGTGQFPPKGSPRVLWVGCQSPAQELEKLHAAVEKAAFDVGVPREKRAFTGHITLGRVKSGKNLNKVVEVLNSMREEEFGSFEVRGITLYKSTLTPTGPIYEALETFSFGIPDVL